MKKSTKIILITALSMVLVGGGLSAAAWMISGGNVGVTWNENRDLVRTTTPGRDMRTDRLTTIAFDRIQIDTDYGDVELIPTSGNAYRVDHSTISSLAEPEITVENGVLRIINTPVGEKGEGLFSGLGTSAQLFNRLGDDAYFRIYYPSDVTPTEATVVTGLGEIEITDSAFSGNLDLTAHMGDIDLLRSTADRVVIDAAMGEVDCEGLNASFLKVDAAMGDVDVENATLNGIQADLAMGEGSFSGWLIGDMDVSANMGSVDFEIYGAKADYYLDLDTDMGEIQVNDRKYRSGDEGSAKAPNKLTVSCNMGEIDVDFSTGEDWD